MRLRTAAALALAPALAVLTACGATLPQTGRDSAEPTVLASFYPLQYVAQRVVGDHARVENLTQPGVEPHDLELTVGQTMEIVDADVVLYERGFQPAVDQAVSQNAADHALDAGGVAHLVGDNPHFWLDPLRLGEVARAFERRMSQADPRHAADYRTNLAGLQRDLRTLDARYRAGLAHCQVHTTVVTHDAFGYLGKYGLRFVSISGLSPEAEPSPSHIAQLQQLIRQRGVTTVFSEELASPEMAHALARDLGLRSAVLDPIEGLGPDTRDQDYLSLMDRNLTALQEANQCS